MAQCYRAGMRAQGWAGQGWGCGAGGAGLGGAEVLLPAVLIAVSLQGGGLHAALPQAEPPECISCRNCRNNNR